MSSQGSVVNFEAFYFAYLNPPSPNFADWICFATTLKVGKFWKFSKNTEFFLAVLVNFLATFFLGKVAVSLSSVARTPKSSITVNIFEKCEPVASLVHLGPKLRLISTKRLSFQKWAPSTENNPYLGNQNFGVEMAISVF